MNRKITSFFIYFSGLFVCLFFIAATTPVFSQIDKRIFIESEILVKYKSIDKVQKIKVPQGRVVIDVIEEYKKNLLVEYAEPNFLYQATIIPNDTYYNEQWYLQKIKAQTAWEKVNSSPDIVIAIIDSGVQIDHPDLKSNIWRNFSEIPDNNIDDDKNGFIDDIHGWDFINNIPDPSPKFEIGFTEAGVLHGTIVAGIAAASGNNNIGIAGITWQSLIMPLRVLNDQGSGKTSEVIRAIDYAIANGADIINFSFVGFGYSQALDEAIRRAYQAGIIIVAAAGNEQDEGSGYNLNEVPMYPVCHDGKNGENMVIGVAATDTLDQKADFSSYGFKCVDISAPGISVFSTVVYNPSQSIDGKIFNKYYDGYWAGTSMAVPMVSGTAALLEAANPKLNRDQIVNSILHSTDNISRLNPTYLGQLGNGRLNVARAVEVTLQQLTSEQVNLIVAPNSDYTSNIKITDYNGQVKNDFIAYNSNFLGGAYVSSGDVDGDGQTEIITGAGYSGGPHVRIFDNQGNLEGQFFAYAENFRGGVQVAVGDVDGDGQAEIITGAGYTGGPHVRIFDSQGNLEGQFFAYAENFRGGVRVAVGDIDGGAARKKFEIITAPGPGGGPHIRIFDNHGNLEGQFFAYDKNFHGGISLAAGDVDNDGLADVITGAGESGSPHVRVFKKDGTLIGSFLAFAENFIGGVNVGVIKVQN
ncbi:MAG: S8 family serine peptidase [Patescibacteria group bacterium]